MNRPNVFVIGFPKSGTTSIAHWFSQSDFLYVPTVKEPMYLSKEWSAFSKKLGFDNEEKYLSLYRKTENFLHRVDASTHYVYSKNALDQVSGLGPSTRVLISWRDHPGFVKSWYNQLKVSGYLKEGLTLREYWEGDGLSYRALDYVPDLFFRPKEFACFGKWVEPWVNNLASEQLAIVKLPQMKENVDELVGFVERFLDCDLPKDISQLNYAVQPKNKLVSFMIRSKFSTTVRNVGRSILPETGFANFKDSLRSKVYTSSKSPPIENNLSDEITEYFKQDREYMMNLQYRFGLEIEG